MTRFLSLLLASCTLACGGGGGGGGGGGAAGGGGPGGGAASTVTFAGFSFVIAEGVETAVPPVENLSAFPPSVGAPLDTTVVFHFSGVPAGPFNQSNLPVYTTPANINPAAGASGSVATIAAKGTYTLVTDAGAGLFTVQFRPFVPTAPLKVDLKSPPESVPGLIPASTYTASVATSLESKIGNLQGAGGSVNFGTTSNPAAYYPKDPGDVGAPVVTATLPASGSSGFYPRVFSTKALDSLANTFPAGPSDFTLTYDKPLQPTQENIEGRDIDGDGIVEPSFSVWARATRLLVGQTVPSDVLFSGHGPFPAISGLEPGMSPSATGDDIILKGGDGAAIPASLFMPSRPAALASDLDAGLLYVVYARDGQTDLFSLGDHLLGDPSRAALAVTTSGGSTAAVLDTGLDALVGLLTLLDGRLIGFDQGTQRIVELAPQFTRKLGDATGANPGPPVLTSLTTAAGGAPELFLGPVWPAGIEVLDLAQSPSGDLYALVRGAPAAAPSVVRVTAIDPNVDGTFGAGEGALGPTVLDLSDEYSAMEFDSEGVLLALNRSSDSLDRLELDTGIATVVVSNVGNFGRLPVGPDGLSNATTLAFGRLELGLTAQLLSNDSAGALMKLTPTGVLPFGTQLTVMQRNTLTTLSGSSEVNADLEDPNTPLGWVAVQTVTTSDPVGSPMLVDDVFLEEFTNTVYEDTQSVSTSPRADWANPGTGSAGTGLRASAGASPGTLLGDFLPTAAAGFKDNLAWVRADPPWVGAHDETDDPEFSLDMTRAGYKVVLLDTDSQAFPLAGGFTPGVTAPTVVQGGQFTFRDFIIPEGVHVIARGSNPLRITATGKIEIRGMLDVRGTNGFSDDTFDSGFLPVPGGAPGPGAGRGGDSHPTRFDPNGTGGLDQFVTPETGERGFGPVITATGGLEVKPIGGFGGLCTVGYAPNSAGYPVPDLAALASGPVPNSEHHRPPGGGGGSFYQPGRQAHTGSGAYRVQSESTWWPFSKCIFDDTQRDALYGNDEKVAAGIPGEHHTQCVYIIGSLANPERVKPGGLPGDLVFKDADADNDFIGEGGELTVLVGGQGGGGGGSRVDSIRHNLWSLDHVGTAVPVPLAPPHYPILFGGGTLFFPPTLFDGKGGAGGGGGGSVQLRSFGSIILSKDGHIDARGGHGGGGEVVQNGNVGGGGGGGSGGAVLLQAAGSIQLLADAGHRSASYLDANGLRGASVEVSGGFGRDSQTETPSQNYWFKTYTWEWGRSDGGQGGMGLIQLQSGGGPGSVVAQDGAFLFAKLRGVQKQNLWTGHTVNAGWDHPDTFTNNPPPVVLRYIDMLHYRTFKPNNVDDRYFVLNGSYPPIIKDTNATNNSGPVNSYDSVVYDDTRTIANSTTGGVRVVQEPQPSMFLKTYAGYNPTTFAENFTKPQNQPGDAFLSTDEIPFSIYLNTPDGTPLKGPDGVTWDLNNVVDRLPVVPLGLTPPPIGTTSVGRSQWIDFGGVVLRPRDGVSGRHPPLFDGFHGTYNPGQGAVPAGADGRVRTGATVPFAGIPAKWVAQAQANDDPGLFLGTPVGTGNPPNPPFNDVKVDAPDQGVALINAITNNSNVVVRFQGARAIRQGSHVADPDTVTAWVSDLSALSGYQLVRFEVFFDMGVDIGSFPFGPQAYRPMVDSVRMRASY